MNVFEAVKQSVTARQAAEHYGIKVNRNGMACCPFHDDKNPSMKLDGRYFCFGCGETGDVIDLTAKLHGLTVRAAALKLADDFGIILPDRDSRNTHYRKRILPQLKQDPKKKQEEEVRHGVKVLLHYLSLLREWHEECAPRNMEEEWNPLFCEALERQVRVEYLLDELTSCSADQLWNLYSRCREAIKVYERRVEQCERGNPSADRSGQGFTGMHNEGRRKAVKAELCDRT